MKSVVQFLQEVQREFVRIEWPSLREFLGSTLVVLFLTTVFTAFLWVIDYYGISSVMYYIFRQSV